MSIKKLISIRNPIIDALDLVGADRSTDEPVFMGWAVEAEKEIKSPSALKRVTKVITVKGCRAELPCCIVRLDIAILGDHGCDCDDLLMRACHGTLFANNLQNFSGGFLIVDVDSNVSNYNGGILNYEIQDNHLVFPRNMDGEKITIQYVGYKEDEKGFIMISENHVRAIREYILYMYGVRSEYSDKPLSPVSTANHKKEWGRLCKHSRALDNDPTPAEREEMRQIFNNPYKGEGLWVNMFPQGYNWY